MSTAYLLSVSEWETHRGWPVDRNENRELPDNSEHRVAQDVPRTYVVRFIKL